MVYRVNEIFKSIQGEGVDTGRLAVFVRLAGCNLNCKFCDTSFDTFTKYTEEELIGVIKGFHIPYIVFTGGEPTLQNLEPIVHKLYRTHYLGIETNGTVRCTYAWMFCSASLSPKTSFETIEFCWKTACRSIKILFPYLSKVNITDYQSNYFEHKYRSLQPINNSITPELLKAHEALGDNWRIGLQIHKILEVK